MGCVYGKYSKTVLSGVSPGFWRASNYAVCTCVVIHAHAPSVG